MEIVIGLVVILALSAFALWYQNQDHNSEDTDSTDEGTETSDHKSYRATLVNRDTEE